ncbi:DUF6177 family protein [Cellulomonas sp. NS3]|uniref:DUF6177 family protein n=1 Tax=Cellulomonas sp. NS3 TaxID=2973977 RepID=UPI002162846C|nr:DUF6177 family protein [Cellulomonas sp. NS3]
MHIVHPVADEWDDEYAVFVASGRSVLLSEPLAAFLDFARTERLRPVLVTSADARLSPFVSLAMRRAAGHWAVRHEDGRVFDGLSGYRIDSFPDLWQRSGTEDRDRLGTFERWSAEPRGALMFDVFAHQRAAADTRIGELAASVVGSLGGQPLDVWGLHEPLVEAWDTAVLTETARRGMPASELMHARGPDGSFVDVAVARTRRGVLEQVKGGVPVGAYPGTIGGVVAQASATLAAVAEAFQPTIGFVSLAETDEGVTQGVSAKRLEVPLAVVIGPRGVHDLRVDPAQLAERHDVTVLGRKRLPSVLVRFSDPDVGLWAQLVAFAHDLGYDRIAAATGLDTEV